MRLSRSAIVALAAVVGACGADTDAAPAAWGGSAFAVSPARQWILPRELDEISGLAVTPDGRLLAHDDERAVIYEIDNDAGRAVKRFALGDPIERGDFEGIAAAPDGALFLVTSAGRLYRFEEGGDGESVAFETFDTGLSETCEIEGLAFDPQRDSLILACKITYIDAMENDVALYAWSLDARVLDATPWLVTPKDALGAAVGEGAFNPSGVALDPASGRIVLVAARQNALAELDADGRVIAARALGRHHRQAEGVAILPERASGSVLGSALVLADESDGRGARLTTYERADD